VSLSENVPCSKSNTIFIVVTSEASYGALQGDDDDLESISVLQVHLPDKILLLSFVFHWRFQAITQLEKGPWE
jgi:hypothetical protein